MVLAVSNTKLQTFDTLNLQNNEGNLPYGHASFFQEEARAANLTSLIYQADQTLRRVITEKMAEAKGLL